MATTTLPQRHARSGRIYWIIGGALLALGVIAALLVSLLGNSSATTAPASTSVARGRVVATASGSGTVAAAQSLDLAFQASGTVTQVHVAAGDTVVAGQALAQLDTRELDLQVASAQAALESAQIRLAQTRQADVQPADLSAQQAAVASAQAQLKAAQAQLAALQNPAAQTIDNADSAVRQAELALQATRDSSSASKTKAEQDLKRAVASLTQAQSKYATALQNWQHVQESGTDPISPSKTDTSGKSKPNTLNDAQRQQYYDAFIQAEAALRSAELAVQQAQLAYDSARGQEITSIQQAEAKLADAQRQLAALRHPTSSDLAQRQASVDQARAGLVQAQANLAKLSAPGTASAIELQQAAMTQAEQQLEQARIKRDQATLRAPFAGIVTAVNIVPGANVGSAGAAFTLLNRSPLHVDLKLSENDVVKVQAGQPVTLTIDALRDWQATGVVSYIAPAAEASNGVVTYAVRVSFPDDDARVKVGMTANLSITTAAKDGVLLVPNSALVPKGAAHAVLVVGPDGSQREVEVQTGLTDGVNTEITSGLEEGDQVVTTATIGTSAQRQGGLFGGRP